MRPGHPTGSGGARGDSCGCRGGLGGVAGEGWACALPPAARGRTRVCGHGGGVVLARARSESEMQRAWRAAAAALLRWPVVAGRATYYRTGARRVAGAGLGLPRIWRNGARAYIWLYNMMCVPRRETLARPRARPPVWPPAPRRRAPRPRAHAPPRRSRCAVAARRRRAACTSSDCCTFDVYNVQHVCRLTRRPLSLYSTSRATNTHAPIDV